MRPRIFTGKGRAHELNFAGTVRVWPEAWQSGNRGRFTGCYADAIKIITSNVSSNFGSARIHVGIGRTVDNIAIVYEEQGNYAQAACPILQRSPLAL